MQSRSSKAKGRRFENFIVEEIKQMGLGYATRTAGSGSGLEKGDIFSSLPWSIECKNQQSTKTLQWIDQTKREAEQGNFDRDKWLLLFRDPREPEFTTCYALLDMWELLKLLKKDKEPLSKKPDKELKWHLTRLKDSLNQVIKRL